MVYNGGYSGKKAEESTSKDSSDMDHVMGSTDREVGFLHTSTSS